MDSWFVQTPRIPQVRIIFPFSYPIQDVPPVPHTVDVQSAVLAPTAAGAKCLLKDPRVCPILGLTSTPLRFAAMSSDAPNVAAYYLQYELTVYDNLFVGIVYGEGQETRRFFSSF
jgi:hypothetical protein